MMVVIDGDRGGVPRTVRGDAYEDGRDGEDGDDGDRVELVVGENFKQILLRAVVLAHRLEALCCRRRG